VVCRGGVELLGERTGGLSSAEEIAAVLPGADPTEEKKRALGVEARGGRGDADVKTLA